MPMNRANSASILTPEQVQSLIVRPVTRDSIAAQVSTIVSTASATVRFPVVTQDPVASWVNEGQEIPLSSVELAEVTVTPGKLAALDVLTRELMDDSDPAALQLASARMTNSIASQLDLAFFSVVGSSDGAMAAGLGGLANVAVVDAGEEWESLDPFIDGLAASEDVGAAVDSWVANPDDARALAKLKSSAGSNVPLLGSDPTAATRRQVQGVPLYVSPAVPTGTVYGLPRLASYVILRDDVEVTSDRSVFYTSDRVAVRATMRVGYAWPHPASVVRITVGA